MKYAFEILEITRNNMLNVLSGLSNAQLNTIPAGFTNNIIWNAAHCVTTQQILCYKLSGLDMQLPEAQIEKNKKGTFPDKTYSDVEIVFWKTKLRETAREMEEDFKEGLFKTYETYTTSFNITLTDIEKAIAFNNTHEALHLGYMMALKKAVLNS